MQVCQKRDVTGGGAIQVTVPIGDLEGAAKQAKPCSLVLQGVGREVMGRSPTHPASHPRSELAGDVPDKVSERVFCSHSSEHYSGTAGMHLYAVVG